MTLLVCSNSTRRFFPDIQRVHVVTGAARKDLLRLAGSEEQVIAIGGGAVIDTAKILAKSSPVCYPTTGAGSTATSWAVYWDGQKKCSYAAAVPQHVHFVDRYIADLPSQILEYTMYDVVSHCYDSLWSNKATAESRHYAREALSLIKNRSAGIDVIHAGHVAGKAINITSTSLLHCLSYPLTGRYGIAHGKALGLLLPAVCQWMGEDVQDILGIFNVEITIDIDYNRVVAEALQYPKIFNTNRPINPPDLLNMLTEK